MTDSEALSLEETLSRLAEHADRHYRLAKGVVLQFHELTKAVSPVMLGCRDVDALIQFKADLTRINGEVQRLLLEAEEAGEVLQ